MIKNIVVEAEQRTETGKNACSRLRRAGRVPAILYGMDRPPFSLSVSPRRIDEVLKLESGRNTIFNLSLAGQDKTRAVMIKDLLRDPVTERLLHVDFIRVDLGKKVSVQVPVRLLGTPDGVKNQGGVLEWLLREVEVECLPTEIPEHLDVDITELGISQHVDVSKLTAGPGVKILHDNEAIICTIAPPRVEEQPVAEGAEAAPTEPEVIKKGKEAGAESEGEAKAK